MTNPDSLAAKIDRLKTLLVGATDFSEPMDWFFDRLMIDPEFRKAGQALADEQVESRFRGVLEVLHQQLTPASDVKAQMVTATWMPAYEFAHGLFSLGGYLGVVFYFRELDMGLSALASVERMSGVLFSRFSVYDKVPRAKALHLDRSGRRH